MKTHLAPLLRRFRKALIAAGTTTLITLTPAVDAAVTGPVSGQPTMLGSTSLGLSSVGYQSQEFFVSGKARSFTNTTPMTTDGKWSTKVVDQKDFKTRILVYRPTDVTKFNGTVIVEWLNISGGTEAASSWIMAHTELIRKGYAWVGVSAQKGGIDGGGINYVGLPLHLKLINFFRYASLVHPGDKYAYDIFGQVGKAIAEPSGVNPLAGLNVQRVIGLGESQAADFLLTYINARALEDKVFDGYFVHSRLHGSAGLSAPQTSGSSINFASRPSVQLRDDLDVPAMMVQTETDLLVLGSYADRQPDSSNFRLWEIAGAGHADRYVSSTGIGDRGDDPEVARVEENKSAIPILVTCDKPVNSGPQHFVVKAAISALDNWLRTGVAPPYADRIQVDASTKKIQRDGFGIAVGGIRTPYVDTPIATLSGEGQSGGVFCALYGTTDLFDSTQLAGLYPNHATYVSAVDSSSEAAVAAGFLLPPDAALIKTWAQNSNIGN